MADNRKLAQGLMMMTPAMRADLAGREQDIQRGKTVELLRRAGKEMYDNPIVNTAIGFTPVLGDVQAAGETMSALNRGAPWQETAGYAVGMLPFIPMVGKTVWHGSPHTFDKFDLSKIGTGEGAQAYGHGLYLADAPEVAKEYQNMVRAEVNGKPFTPGPFDPEFGALNELHKSKNDYAAAKKALEERAIRQKVDLSPEINALNDMEAKSVKANLGALYKVDLPDEQIAKMLDWDKPLSQQAPEVLQALEQSPQYQHFANINQQNPNLYQHPSEFEAKKFYGMIGESPEDASRILREQGILGIQYLDQASRNQAQRFIARSPQGGESVFNSAEEAQQFIQNMAKRGHEFEYVDPNLTRNYVVFSDEIPQILERNGQPVAQALRNYEAPKQSTLQDVVSPIEQRGVTLDVYESNKKPLMTLSRIEVPKEMRGQGVGTQAMQDLVNYANQQGKTIALSPSTDFGGTSVNRLKDFYKQFGFVENKGRNKDFEISESMYRLPETE